MSVRAKKHRLPPHAYFGQKTVSFTVCEERRQDSLNDEVLVSQLLSILASSSSDFGCIVPLYCFMPHHLHIVLMGQTDASRAKSAMDRFKYDAGVWLGMNRPDVKLQGDYYDRLIRQSEDWVAHVRYVALNPVRAGLATSVADWPYTGSIGCELKEILLDAFW